LAELWLVLDEISNGVEESRQDSGGSRARGNQQPSSMANEVLGVNTIIIHYALQLGKKEEP
jgi:hypothetical protein